MRILYGHSILFVTDDYDQSVGHRPPGAHVREAGVLEFFSHGAQRPVIDRPDAAVFLQRTLTGAKLAIDQNGRSLNCFDDLHEGYLMRRTTKTNSAAIAPDGM